MICPNCKGKGHVLDALAACLPFYGQILAVLERNNKRGFTREICDHCDGTGFVENN